LFTKIVSSILDEEYRVRSATITAIASIRAKDGQTPPSVLQFLESLLVSKDGAALEKISTAKDSTLLHSAKRARRIENIDMAESDDDEDFVVEQKISDAPYVSSQVMAEALLALCHVNCRPAVIEVSSGVAVQVHVAHPILPLMEACHRLVEWELYKESIRLQSNANSFSIVGENSFTSTAACGITALSQLAILRNCTSNLSRNEPLERRNKDPQVGLSSGDKRKESAKHSDKASSSQFYVDIFDENPHRSDIVRAAAAQAVVCICCAADRLKRKKSETFGLLTALEFLMNRIIGTFDFTPFYYFFEYG